MDKLIGKGREAIDLIIDADSFKENTVGSRDFDPELGPAAVVGTALLKEREITVISIDAQAFNDRFPVVYFGVIGLEEAYKMSLAVYATIQADRDRPVKRPILLIVDTPGNGPGKTEEIVGINKATGAYQLALAEARKAGHPVTAMIIGRAISGAFLCHGLQADRILALSGEFGTMVHVMPLTSISRITKLDLEKLEELARVNPVFAAGVEFFYQLGGLEEIVNSIQDMRPVIARHIEEIYDLKAKGQDELLGPRGRGTLGTQRGGRKARGETLKRLYSQYELAESRYLL